MKKDNGIIYNFVKNEEIKVSIEVENFVQNIDINRFDDFEEIEISEEQINDLLQHNSVLIGRLNALRFALSFYSDDINDFRKNLKTILRPFNDEIQEKNTSLLSCFLNSKNEALNSIDKGFISEINRIFEKINFFIKLEERNKKTEELNKNRQRCLKI